MEEEQDNGVKKDILMKEIEYKIQEPVERQTFKTIYCIKQEKNWYKIFGLYC